MTEVKVGDRIVIGKNSIAVDEGTVFVVVEKLRVSGVWIDCTFKEVDIKYVSKGYKNSYADFKLVEEEKVKSRFAVGDHVISIKNTPEVPEGFIGHITATNGDVWSYTVDDGKGKSECFNEDELELLSASHTTELVVEETKPASALDKQVSGDHYKDCKIQPIEYIHANGLSYLEGNVIKYTTRHSKKNGRKDIEKAIHYLELILEMEYKDKE